MSPIKSLTSTLKNFIHPSHPASSSNSSPVKLGYFDIKGLMQAARDLMEYIGAEYEDVLYPVGDTQKWLDEKFSLGLDFPNVPYLIDEEAGIKLTQSTAIYRYICRKYNKDLLGKTPKEEALVDMVMECITELRIAAYRLTYGPDVGNSEVIEAFKTTTLPTALKSLEAFKAGKTYLIGDYVTYVDFVLLELWGILSSSFREVTSQFKDLSLWVEKMEALPSMVAYKKGDKFKKIS